jgi:putative transposase
MDVFKKKDSEPIEPKAMLDHARLLVEVEPRYGMDGLVKEIKGLSPRLLRAEFKYLTTRMPTIWTNSYFVSTVGGASLSVIEQCIENQKHV